MLSLLFLSPGVGCYEQRGNPSSLLIPGFCDAKNSGGAAGSLGNVGTREEGWGQDGRNQRRGKPPSLRGWALSFPACPPTLVFPEHHSLSHQGWIRLWNLPGTDKPAGMGNRGAFSQLHHLPFLWILCGHPRDISVPQLL